MKNKVNNVLSIISILLLSINTFLKFNVLLLITSLLLIFLLIIANRKINRKYCIAFTIFTSIITLMSIVSKSFFGNGIILLLLFLLIISLAVMIKFKLAFEVSLPIGVSLLIIIYILIAAIGLLNISTVILVIISLICLIIIYKNDKYFINAFERINYTSLIIFMILCVVAVISSRGRYVHKWDEYSYWAFAAKSLINSNSLKMMVSNVSSMYNYPPVSSIWHYIVSLFTGYSEQNLYMGLSIITYVYLMPAMMYCRRKKLLFNILFVISAVCFPLLFDGSISYGLLYVDLLLGVMCSSILILNDYFDEENKSRVLIYTILIVITLLKPNGFVFAMCILFLFYLRKIFRTKNLNINYFIKVTVKYILIALIPLIIYGLWVVLSKHFNNPNYGYMFKLIPDSLKTDIGPKLNYTFICKFIVGIINTFDENILYGFVNVPLFAFLVIIFTYIFVLERGKEKNEFKLLLPYFIFYITFLVITAFSLFIMFSYYEASILASFTRYLSPINTALVLYILYKLSATITYERIEHITLVVIIILVGFSRTTFFITDIEQRMDTKRISNERKETFSIITRNTPKNSKIFVLNQSDEDGIMPVWYARFYSYPRIINASSVAITWKIKTDSNTWDLKNWGLSAESFTKHLKDYGFEYLFLYTKTDEMYKELEIYFEDFNNAKKCSLFKIESNNNSIRLIPVK